MDHNRYVANRASSPGLPQSTLLVNRDRGQTLATEQAVKGPTLTGLFLIGWSPVGGTDVIAPPEG